LTLRPGYYCCCSVQIDIVIPLFLKIFLVHCLKTQETNREHNQITESKTEWLTHQMIKLSFHICVQKRLVTLTTAPKYVIFSPQIMCYLQYIFIRKINNVMVVKIQSILLLLLYYIYTSVPPWPSSLEQQHMHTPLTRSCKAVHFVSHEPIRHKDCIDKQGR
jgi:hypothetical protein